MIHIPLIELGEKSFQLKAWIQPSAKENQICGVKEGWLRIRIHAKPAKGAANKELILFLSKLLQVSRQCVEIVKGHTSRKKLLEIHGIEKQAFQELFEDF